MKPVISIIMGSKSDWAAMQKTAEVLDRFGVTRKESCFRTVPDLMFKHAEEHVAVASRSLSQVRVAQLTCQGWSAKSNPSSYQGTRQVSMPIAVRILFILSFVPGGVPVATMAIN